MADKHEQLGEDKDQWCFGCGVKNPIGLHLVFTEADGYYMTEFTAGPEHQGYDGIVHGGIISTLLDEAMARYINSKGGMAVTARLEVRYLKSVPIGVPLTIRAHIVSSRKRLYSLAATVALADGTSMAEGQATIMVTGDTTI